MSKTVKAAKPAHDGKGFFALAGEAFSVLGEEIIEGKDKVVEAASEKFTAVKKAIKKKIAHKKSPPASQAKKKIAPKKAAKKVIKKIAKKVAPSSKKTAKKSTPAKRKA